MQIAGGDWRFFFNENIGQFAGIPSAWDSSLNTGVGISSLSTMWITTYLNITALFGNFGLSWNSITLFFWILPTIIVSTIGSYLLFNEFWQLNKRHLALLSSLIYISNTYILMVFSGGQLGVVFAYSLFPVVLYRFIKVAKIPNYYNSVFLGCVLSILILFDPRIAVLLLIPISLYLLLRVKLTKKHAYFLIFLPLLIVLLSHNYWIVPLLWYRYSSLVPDILKASSASFFSFAFLENAVSLLHPNWWENIFGKVHFMRPEFLLLPIIALMGFVGKKFWSNKTAGLFLLLLISSFFAKGTNEPFGLVYELFYDYVPGFAIFRDSTKFYILIAISYSLLIPSSLNNLEIWLSKFQIIGNKANFVVFGLFFILWLALIYPLISLKIGGIFKLHELPQEYISLKEIIIKDDAFYRTLWIPQWQRFGYFSNTNPAIGRGELFASSETESIFHDLKSKGFEDRLRKIGVKYVIVPYDSEKEIFTDQGKYSDSFYKRIVENLKRIPYLSNVGRYGNMQIFKTIEHNERFFSLNKNIKIKYKKINNSFYEVSVLNGMSGAVIFFSESYSPFWVMKVDGHTIGSAKGIYNLNTFKLPKSGNSIVSIEFLPQKYVNISFIFSCFFMSMIIIYIFVYPIKFYGFKKKGNMK